MIWLRLLGFASWLKNAATSVFGLIRAYPLQAALIVALVAAGWQWRGRQQALAERDAARTEIAALIEASKANRLAAERQIAERQSKLDQISKDAENDYKTIAKGSDTRLDAYIKRMRIKNDCVSTTPASPERESPGVPSDLPANTGMVAIRDDDLQALVEWFAIGLAAHNQAVTKIEAGVAEPDRAIPAVEFGP